jgi:putative ABC transport system permease protein
VPALVAQIAANKELNVKVMPLKEMRKSLADLDRLLRLVFILLSLLGVVASVALAATMNASVALRLPEMAALVAIGIRRTTLARIVILETLLLTAIATLIGVVASEIVRRAIGSVPNMSVTRVDLAMSPLVPIAGAGIGLVVGILGGLVPALRVTRIDVVSTLR